MKQQLQTINNQIRCDICDRLLINEYHNVYQHQMKEHGQLGNIRGKLKSQAYNSKPRPIKQFSDLTQFLSFKIINPLSKEIYVFNYAIADWCKWSQTKLDFLSTKKEFDLMLMVAIVTFKIEYAEYLGEK